MNEEKIDISKIKITFTKNDIVIQDDKQLTFVYATVDEYRKLQQENSQLKELRNKAIEYNNENIKRIYEQTFGPFNAIPKIDVIRELEAVNKILESNKED